MHTGNLSFFFIIFCCWLTKCPSSWNRSRYKNILVSCWEKEYCFDLRTHTCKYRLFCKRNTWGFDYFVIVDFLLCFTPTVMARRKEPKGKSKIRASLTLCICSVMSKRENFIFSLSISIYCSLEKKEYYSEEKSIRQL